MRAFYSFSFSLFTKSGRARLMDRQPIMHVQRLCFGSYTQVRSAFLRRLVLEILWIRYFTLFGNVVLRLVEASNHGNTASYLSYGHPRRRTKFAFKAAIMQTQIPQPRLQNTGTRVQTTP